MPEKEKNKNWPLKAETMDGRNVKDLILTQHGWLGSIDNLKMLWDENGSTGKGVQWTLMNIR